MSFSVFTNNSRAGRTYLTADLAQQDADDRNNKAETLGIKSRYDVQPYTLNANTESADKIRELYRPI